MRSFDTLLTDIKDGVLLVTINREDKLNALNKTVFTELNEVLDELHANPEIKGMIITGRGAKAFAAGADIKEFQGLDEQGGRALAQRGHDTFRRIEDCPKPVIAAVNGFALGGGCELSMACHMRIASENAKFGQPEVNLGIVPGYGGTQRMVQLVGKGKALELLMTADVIDASTAHRLCLVNEVVQTGELIDHSREVILKIASKAPYAIAQVIQAVNAYYKDGVDGFAAEIDLFGKCIVTEDFPEGVSAFLEKRKANFKGK